MPFSSNGSDGLEMDGTMIPGLPDLQDHWLLWHEVKLATMIDARDIDPPFYMAGTENAEKLANWTREGWTHRAWRR